VGYCYFCWTIQPQEAKLELAFSHLLPHIVTSIWTLIEIGKRAGGDFQQVSHVLWNSCAECQKPVVWLLPQSQAEVWFTDMSGVCWLFTCLWCCIFRYLTFYTVRWLVWKTTNKEFWHVGGWRISSSRVWHCVVLVRTNISEEYIASIIRVKRISGLGTTLAVTSNWSKLIMKAICFTETPVLITGATWCHMPEDSILNTTETSDLTSFHNI
jgi:hypothetical protein